MSALSRSFNLNKSQTLCRRAFSMAEIAFGLVLFGLIATTAAPFYYHLINQFRTHGAAASVRATLPAFILHWDEQGNFYAFDSHTAVPSKGGPILADGQSIGVHLPEMDRVRWKITDVQANSISIEWDIEGCADCRAGIQLDIETSADGATHYPVWDYYHYDQPDSR